MSIGDNIKKRREELNLTQEELAKKLGFKNRSTVNKWEKDGSSLKQKRIEEIANVLDCSPAYLMGWESEPALTIKSNNSLTLGQIVKEYRTEHRISMQTFAEKTNLSKGYISMLEKNINPATGREITPSIDTISAIAKAMNISVDELVKILDDDQKISLEKNTDINDSYDIENPDIRMIARAGKKMSGEQAENLRKIAEYLYPEAFGK